MLKHHWDKLVEKLIGLIPALKGSSQWGDFFLNPLFPNIDLTLYSARVWSKSTKHW